MNFYQPLYLRFLKIGSGTHFPLLIELTINVTGNTKIFQMIDVPPTEVKDEKNICR